MASPVVPPFRRAIGGDHPAYRADIDGLRGIAVLAVLAFHAAPKVVAGGFVGVDVFFVISGFLITTILLKSQESGHARLGTFYARRIKRIFPALAVVLVASAALGWVTLLAGEYAQLGKHILGGAAFVSNFVLQGESGYFDTAADQKPLLHLWSLAVEEQFYLVFPLVLLAVKRWRLDVGAAVLVLSCASFAMGLDPLGAGSAMTFYAPFSRFWELMLGGILAHRALTRRVPFAEPPRPVRERSLLAGLGLVLITSSIFALSSERRFPGGWALVPTLGSAALLVAGQDAWPNRRLLSFPVLTWFGRISFPLYLWHWPLLAFVRIATGAPPLPGARNAVVALSVALAWLTHVAIERPLRPARAVRTTTAALAGALALLGVFGFAALRTGGFPRRAVVLGNHFVTPPSERDTGPDVSNRCGQSPAQEALHLHCRIDRRQHPTVALVGDSKALALYDAFVRTSDEQTRAVLLGGPGGIVPVLSDAPLYRSYQALAVASSDYVIADPQLKVVVLATASRLLFDLESDSTIDDMSNKTANGPLAFEGLDRMITKLEAAGRAVIFVVDNPTLPRPEDCIARRTSIAFLNDALGLRERGVCSIPYARQLELSKPYRDVVDALKSKHEALVVFDTLDILCEDKRVCASLDPEGRLLYGFTDHVSAFASGRIARALWPTIKDAVRARTAP